MAINATPPHQATHLPCPWPRTPASPRRHSMCIVQITPSSCHVRKSRCRRPGNRRHRLAASTVDCWARLQPQTTILRPPDGPSPFTGGTSNESGRRFRRHPPRSAPNRQSPPPTPAVACHQRPSHHSTASDATPEPGRFRWRLALPRRRRCLGRLATGGASRRRSTGPALHRGPRPVPGPPPPYRVMAGPKATRAPNKWPAKLT